MLTHQERMIVLGTSVQQRIAANRRIVTGMRQHLEGGEPREYALGLKDHADAVSLARTVEYD